MGAGGVAVHGGQNFRPKEIKGLRSRVQLAFTMLVGSPHPRPLPTEGEGRRLGLVLREAIVGIAGSGRVSN